MIACPIAAFADVDWKDRDSSAVQMEVIFGRRQREGGLISALRANQPAVRYFSTRKVPLEVDCVITVTKAHRGISRKFCGHPSLEGV